MSIIDPSVLSGFRDFLPSEMIQRQRLMDIARSVYQSFGFAPIDTPTLEKLEILLGKGSEEADRQMYQFEDQGNRKVGMRFDLTVPLARFSAQHINELGTPFKRFHIAPVWRGERPQHGRYREFIQCDFDTIGTTSLLADVEMVLVIDRLLCSLGFERFEIHVNNRKLLNGMLQSLGLVEHSTVILRALDKLAKVGAEKVADEMVRQAGITLDLAKKVLQLVDTEGDSQEILAVAQSLIGDNPLGNEGIAELEKLLDATKAAGVPQQRVQLDVSIARGLEYYTGTIVETILLDDPMIGSVCSGGRYDNLAGLYTKKELPGVGASLGLDRILVSMQKLGMLEGRSSPTDVLILNFDEALQLEYFRWASELRTVGLNVEIYPETAKLKKQMKYADRHSIPAVLIAGSQEAESNKVQVKWMTHGEQEEISIEGSTDSMVQRFREKLLGDATSQ